MVPRNSDLPGTVLAYWPTVDASSTGLQPKKVSPAVVTYGSALQTVVMNSVVRQLWRIFLGFICWIVNLGKGWKIGVPVHLSARETLYESLLYEKIAYIICNMGSSKLSGILPASCVAQSDLPAGKRCSRRQRFTLVPLFTRYVKRKLTDTRAQLCCALPETQTGFLPRDLVTATVTVCCK